MNTDTVNYLGKEYTLREVFAKYEDDPDDEGQFISIGPESLVELLINNHGLPVSPEAEYIDNKIYFYLPDEFLATASDEDVANSVDEMIWCEAPED